MVEVLARTPWMTVKGELVDEEGKVLVVVVVKGIVLGF
jgi:hypothetical protein